MPTNPELKAIQASDAPSCCKQGENLVRSMPQPNLVLNTCSVCGRRHFRVQGQKRVSEPA